MSAVDYRTGEIVSAPTEDEVRASIQRVHAHVESIWDEWAWQVENQTWLILGYPSWDEMRAAVYASLTNVSAPRAERPELVARFRGAGLTQQQTAATLGVTTRTVKSDEHPEWKEGKNFPSEPEDIVDAEVIEAEPPDPDPFGWDRTFESFLELGRYLKKNPSPGQRKRLVRGLEHLLEEIRR